MVQTSSCLELLTPHNYHTWKSLMTRLLQSKGLWSCLDVMQLVLQRPFKVMQYKKKMDEAMGLISLQVSGSLLFHLNGCNTPLAMWTKLNGFFCIVNEFRTLQIEAGLTSLVPDSFPSIEEFLMNFKQQKYLLQDCGKIKTDTECIYLILSKLHGNFQVFASTFHSTMDALGTRFTMPSFDIFCDCLT